MAAPEVREVHRPVVAHHRKVKLKGPAPDNVLVAAHLRKVRPKGRARDNVLLVEARAARRLEAEDRAWLT